MQPVVISAFQEALQQSQAIVPDTNPDKTGTLNGKTISPPWSYYVLVGGAIIGTISAVVATIVSMTPVIVGGIILMATNALGAYYIKSLGNLKTLEDYVQILSKKIKLLVSQIINLKKDNNVLAENIKNLQKVVADDKKIFDDGAKQIEDKSKELDKVASELSETQKKLADIQKVYDSFSGAVGAIADDLSKFTAGNITMNTLLTNLGGYISNLQAVADTLNHDFADLKNQTVSFDLHNKDLSKLIDSLTLQINLFMKIHDESQKQISALETQVANLTKVDQDVSSNASKVEDYEKQLADVKDQLKQLLDAYQKPVGDLVQYLQALKKAQESQSKSTDAPKK